MTPPIATVSERWKQTRVTSCSRSGALLGGILRKHCKMMERRPIQTSAVIVLGTKADAAIPPPSPPTPCALPSDNELAPLTEPLELDQGQYKSDKKHLIEQPDISPAGESRLRRGIHVMATEATALANLAKFYETSSTARCSFDKAVNAITRQALVKGKLVVVGVGKSGLIGRKLVATMLSLDIRAVFLHPTEALHGDLGIIDHRDTLMFISYSGKTPELLTLLPHIEESMHTLLLTSHINTDTCEFTRRRPGTIMLPTPIPESESASFGVPAPTTSTTVALALGDALALTAAHEMQHNVAAVFAKNHPGGAIGAPAATSI